MQQIATIHSVGNGTCSWSGKKAEGATVSFADSSVKEQFISWTNLKKLLNFKAKSEEVKK